MYGGWRLFSVNGKVSEIATVICFKRLCIAYLAGIALLMGSKLCAQNIPVVTGELPPYSVTQSGQLTGVATDIVREIMRRVDYSHAIEIQPWKRAIVSSEFYQLTYPLARTDVREKHYQWIGPLIEDKFVFAMLTSKVNGEYSLDRLRSLRVGVTRGASTETRLKQLKFNHIESVVGEITNAKKLMAKRIDVWFSTALMVHDQLRLLGRQQSEVTIVAVDMDIDMYLVASLNLHRELVEQWQKALNDIKADGTHQRILLEYDVTPVTSMRY